MLLLAASRGLTASYLNQPVEVTTLRETLRGLLNVDAMPQLLPRGPRAAGRSLVKAASIGRRRLMGNHLINSGAFIVSHARWSVLLAFTSGLFAAGLDTANARVDEPTELVDQQHCMFCHTSDAPFLAPSFRQIADRYRDVPDAKAMLEIKLRKGGRAHWGDTPMPLPAERGGPLSAEDAHKLVEWVMSQ